MLQTEDDVRDWVGRTEHLIDDLSPTQAAGAAAMFDLDTTVAVRDGQLPLLWHWFYFCRAPYSTRWEMTDTLHGVHSFPRSRCRGECSSALV